MISRTLTGSKIKETLLEFLSLTPPLRKYTFLGVLCVLFFIPVKVLEDSPSLSLCGRILGKDCYSLGITRGVASLLKGDLNLALHYNWLAIPVTFFLLGFVIYDFIYEFRCKKDNAHGRKE